MPTIIAGRLRGVGESLKFLIVRRVKLARLKKFAASLGASRRIGATGG
jgi:hypothetical protein